MLLTLTLICLQRWRGRSLADLDFSRGALPPARSLAFILLGALGFQILMGQVVEPYLEWLFRVPKSLPTVPGLAALLLGCAVSFVGGGFREELFFRGYLIARVRRLPGLAPRRAFHLAVVIEVLLFGLSHWYQGPAGVLGTTLIGIGCTWVYLRTRRLWAAVFFHAFFDIFGFFSIYLSQ